MDIITPHFTVFAFLFVERSNHSQLTRSRFRVLLFRLLYCLKLIWLHGAFHLLCTQILSLAPVCNYLFYENSIWWIHFGLVCMAYLMTMCCLFSVLNVLEWICMSLKWFEWICDGLHVKVFYHSNRRWWPVIFSRFVTDLLLTFWWQNTSLCQISHLSLKFGVRLSLFCHRKSITNWPPMLGTTNFRWWIAIVLPTTSDNLPPKFVT